MKTIILAAAAFSLATAAHADIYSHQPYSNDTRVWMMPAPQQPQPNNWQQFQPSAQYNQQQPQYQPQYNPQPCRFINGLMTCQ